MKARDLLQRLRGFSSPFGGLSWNPPPSEREAAQRLIVFLYDRRVLYAPSEAEVPRHVLSSVLEIRRELTDIAKQFSPGNGLELKLRAMRATCLHFLERVEKDDAILEFGPCQGHWANREFLDALGQWRALMAVYIGMVAASYEVEPPLFLTSFLPDIDKPDEAGIARTSAEKRDLSEELEALPPTELKRQLREANRYLASPEGQRRFGPLRQVSADSKTKPQQAFSE